MIGNQAQGHVQNHVLTGEVQGYRYQVDVTDARWTADVVPYTQKPGVEGVADRLYRSHAEARAALSGLDTPVLPSWREIGGKTKSFDDGMYAALEMALQEGLGKLQKGKIEFLQSVASELKALYDGYEGYAKQVAGFAMAYVASGLEIAGESYGFEQEGAKVIAEAHEADKEASKPIGFYTWNETLSTVFKQDRMYQRKLSMAGGFKVGDRVITDSDVATGAAALIAYVINMNADLREAHEKIVGTYERVTNPLASMGVKEYAEALGELSIDEVVKSKEGVNAFREKLRNHPMYAAEAKRQGSTGMNGEERIGLALEPASQSAETNLFQRLQADYANGELMDVFINAIKSGDVSLKPKDGDGWYSWQQWAIAQLLDMPQLREAAKLTFGEEYIKLVEEGVKAAFTQARETHAKQLEQGATMRATCVVEKEIDLEIRPTFSAEPLQTNYLWQARGYRFLRFAVDELLGTDAFENINRLREDGSVSDKPLSAEFDDMVELMYGIYVIACDEAGMKVDLSDGEVTDMDRYKETARAWLNDGIKKDNDLAQDRRVIVPVHKIQNPGSDIEEMVSWATIGVEAKQLQLKWQQPPKVTIYDQENRPYVAQFRGNHASVRMPGVKFNVTLDPRDCYVLYDVFAEIVMPPGNPLTRAEYRGRIDPYIGQQVDAARDGIKRMFQGETPADGSAIGVPGGTAQDLIDNSGRPTSRPHVPGEDEIVQAQPGMPKPEQGAPSQGSKTGKIVEPGLGDDPFNKLRPIERPRTISDTTKDLLDQWRK